MLNLATRPSSPSIGSGRGRPSRSQPWSFSSEQAGISRGRAHLATALLIIHGLVAVALLGAITHQTIAAWVPARGRPGSLFGRFRAVPSGSFANAIVVLYAVSALLGAVVYLPFRVNIRPDLERAGYWQALGFFDLKEHFVAIGLALLPTYWVCWQQQRTDEPLRTPAALTLILAFIVWWSFLIGHVLNNIMGFGL